MLTFEGAENGGGLHSVSKDPTGKLKRDGVLDLRSENGVGFYNVS